MPGGWVSSKSSTWPAVPSAATRSSSPSPAAAAARAAGSERPRIAHAIQSRSAARYGAKRSAPAPAAAPAVSAAAAVPVSARVRGGSLAAGAGEAARLRDELVGAAAGGVVPGDGDHDHLLRAVARGD